MVQKIFSLWRWNLPQGYIYPRLRTTALGAGLRILAFNQTSGETHSRNFTPRTPRSRLDSTVHSVHLACKRLRARSENLWLDFVEKTLIAKYMHRLQWQARTTVVVTCHSEKTLWVSPSFCMKSCLAHIPKQLAGEDQYMTALCQSYDASYDANKGNRQTMFDVMPCSKSSQCLANSKTVLQTNWQATSPVAIPRKFYIFSSCIRLGLVPVGSAVLFYVSQPHLTSATALDKHFTMLLHSASPTYSCSINSNAMFVLLTTFCRKQYLLVCLFD